ncbi:MAG TPA: NAD(P)H-dependent oxidoreductase subunit E, partial [Parvularculaceae bacterium]|nr:NAD(P)H-dependent oxidoreductase subunit E [Parvularculaceae bacterium]
MASRKPAKNQPASFAWTSENKAWCDAQMKKYPEGRQASCVIPFLWRGQKQEGWISIPMMEAIAEQLKIPYIRVYEVATFYSMFVTRPCGR